MGKPLRHILGGVPRIFCFCFGNRVFVSLDGNRTISRKGASDRKHNQQNNETIATWQQTKQGNKTSLTNNQLVLQTRTTTNTYNNKLEIE